MLSANIVVEEHGEQGAAVGGVRKEEIERIFADMTLSDLNHPSISSKVSVGVNTSSSSVSPKGNRQHTLLCERDSLRLDASGNLRRCKSWKK